MLGTDLVARLADVQTIVDLDAARSGQPLLIADALRPADSRRNVRVDTGERAFAIPH